VRLTWCETARSEVASVTTCRGCGAWFGETHGTPMYRLRTPPEEIGQALLVVMRRGSLRAAEEITGHKYETIGRWLSLAAEHAEALTDSSTYKG
jgi:transposase-like protein